MNLLKQNSRRATAACDDSLREHPARFAGGTGKVRFSFYFLLSLPEPFSRFHGAGPDTIRPRPFATFHQICGLPSMALSMFPSAHLMVISGCSWLPRSVTSLFRSILLVNLLPSLLYAYMSA